MPIQKFEVILNTSNEDIEDVRKRLADKLSDWLDDISFTTHKKEICKSVKIIKTQNKYINAQDIQVISYLMHQKI